MWSRFENATSAFCFRVLNPEAGSPSLTDSLALSLIDEGMKKEPSTCPTIFQQENTSIDVLHTSLKKYMLDYHWCASQSFTYLASRFISLEDDARKSRIRIADLEKLCSDLKSEMNAKECGFDEARAKTKQLKDIADDQNWQLHEQLRELGSLLDIERARNYDLQRHQTAVREGNDANASTTLEEMIMPIQIDYFLAQSGDENMQFNRRLRRNDKEFENSSSKHIHIGSELQQ